ncbi:MAG: ESPR-type extended signal peptide-containing protein, partial [Dialister sp.]|nr:ESPR-type extended signal peptide-containing protein [Dialister sp.]
MNKIYKLIWSQSRNGWVVASELAKGHGKNTSSRRRRALITLAAAVLLGSAFLPAEPISAEDPAAGGALPYVSIGTNASHKIKVRRDVKDPSSDKIITIEDESELDLESNKKPLGNPSYNAILIGPEAKTGIGNGSESINGVVAIGFKTTALKQYTTAVGTNAFAGSAGDVALGWKSYTSDYILNPEETRSNKIAIGTESTAKAANGIAIGTQSKIDEYSDNAIAIGRGAEVGLGETSTDSTAIGHEVKVYGTYGVAIGSKATAGTKKDPGGEYVVIGNQSHVYDTNGVVIGAQSSAKENAVVLGSHAEGAMGSVAVGGQTKADTYALAAGQGSKAGEYAVAMGSSAEATEENSIAIGREVTATKERAIAIGRSANAAGSRSLAIGDSAQVTGGGAEDYLSIAVGSQAVVNKKAGTALGAITAVYGEGGTALGRGAFAGSDYATGVGYNAIANSASTVAIGANTRADIEDGIALGSGSQVNEDWGNGKAGMYGYDPDVGGYSNDESSTWKSTRSAVSVGDPEQKITRQIINVAAGMRDTDVVNVAQLKKLKARTAADLKKEKEALDKRITSNAGNINKLSNKVSQHTTDIFGLKQKQKKDFEALNTKIENSTVRFVSVNKEDTDEYTDNYLNDGAKKAGAVAIGVNANAGGEDAVALGPSAYAIGSGSVAIGAGAAQQGGDPEQKKGQFEAGIIVGRDNMVSVEASETGGREDTVIGRLNYVSDSHGAFVRGIGNAVFDAYNDEVLTEDDQQQEERFIIKSEHDNSGLFEKGRSHVAVDGDANSVVGSLYTRVSGVANKLSNEDGQPRMSYNIVTGNRNELTDANRNLILGDNHELEKVNGNIIIGSAKTKQKTAASEVAILGNDANVSVDGGVALGSGSVAGTGAGVAGWDPKTEQTSKETGAAWKSGNGAVSVGAADKTRQITNLAAGTEDTDAVNVAQLKSVKGEVKANAESIGRLQGGFTVKDAGKGTADVALGDTARQAVTFKAAVDDKSSAASSLTAAVDADRNVTYTLNTNQLKKDLGITEAGVGTMSSWQLGVAGDKNIEEIKDGGGVSFAADGKGLTVAREGATITYTIDGSQIDISGNTSITNLNQKIDDASLHYVSIKRTNQSPAPESNYLNDGAKGDGGMAIGEFATSQGRGIAMGYKSRAVPKAGATLGISSFEGIAVGQEANTEVSGGIAIGLRSKVEGTLNTKEGNVNEQGTVALGVDAYAKGNGAAAFGWKARGDGEGAMAFGTETKAAESGTAFGAHSVAAAGGIAMGWQAHANDLVAVSVGTSSDAAKQATAVGAGTTADGIASLAVGVGAVSKGVLSASVGAKSVAEAENSVALGAETVANREAGKVGYIATGGSATFEEALTTLNKKEDYDKWTATVNAAKAEYDTLTKAFNDAADKNKKAEAKQALDNWKGQHADFVEALTAKERLEATWKSTKAAVSVGADSVDAAGNRVIATRQITNLAAGTEDTDAVNVAQLKSVADKASEAADGAKKHTTVVAGDYVTVTEGTNAAGGKEYTVAGPVIKTDSNLTISDIKEGSKKTGYTLG